MPGPTTPAASPASTPPANGPATYPAAAPAGTPIAAYPPATQPQAPAAQAPTQAPPNAYAAPTAAQPTYAAAPQPPNDYGSNANGNAGIVEPPPPPDPKSDSDGPMKFPDFSVRVDPLNWLLAGRLGFELEMGVWKFISVETVPLFVVNSTPPMLNLRGVPDTLSQKSNGVGALAGASIGAGFWLNGKPFEGSVIRFYYTNYGLSYAAADSGGTFDQVSHTERFLVGMLGNHSKWGPFTIATGIGLGVEMNRERRCINPTNDMQTVTSGCTDDEIVIRTQRDAPNYATLTGWAHPVYLLGRISLGFVF